MAQHVDMLQYITNLNRHGNFHTVVGMEQEVMKGATAVRSKSPGYAGALFKCLAVAFCETGSLHRAIELFQLARSIAQELGVRSEEYRCDGNIGVCYMTLGQYAQSVELLESRLRFAEEQGDNDGISTASLNLSNCYRELGQFELALERLEVVKSIAQSEGDRLRLGLMCASLGNSHLQQGRVPKAIVCFEEALAISGELGSKELELKACGSLGLCHLQLGNTEKSLELHRRDLALCRETGDRVAEGIAANNLGLALCKSGELEEAMVVLLHAICTHQEIENLVGPDDSRRVSVFEDQQKAYNQLEAVLWAKGKAEWALGVSAQAKARALSHRLGGRTSLAEHGTGTSGSDEINVERVCSLWWEEMRQMSSREPQCVIVEFSFVFDLQNRRRVAAWALRDGQLEYGNLLPVAETDGLSEILATTRQSMEVYGRNAASGGGGIATVETADKGRLGAGCAVASPSSLTARGKKCKECGYSFDKCDCREKKALAQEANALRELYKVLLAPLEHCVGGAADLLIVPHRELFEVPWAALMNEGGRYLIEEHAIRVSPSLRVACQASDLMVEGGDDEGHVVVMGNPLPLPAPFDELPFAEQEARSVQCALGKAGVVVRDFYYADASPRATKQRVKQSLQGARWAHLACHGDLDTDSLVLSQPSGGGGETRDVKTVSAEYLCDGCDKRCRTTCPMTGPRWTCRDCQDYDLCDACMEAWKRNKAAVSHDADHVFQKVVEEVDHNLTMWEVQGSDRAAGLTLARGCTVVLSACNTGRGEIRAEGVVGLARGFLLAGAASAVVSLWSVGDGSTAALMGVFYQHLVKGLTVAQALRHAMCGMARRPPACNADQQGHGACAGEGAGGLEGEWRRPKHWAGFLVVGANTRLMRTV